MHGEGGAGRDGRQELGEKLFDGVGEQAVDGDAGEEGQVGRRELGDIIREDSLMISVVRDGESPQQRGVLQEV